MHGFSIGWHSGKDKRKREKNSPKVRVLGQVLNLDLSVSCLLMMVAADVAAQVF